VSNASGKAHPNSLPSPKVRAAFPDGDGDYELLDLTASSFSRFANDLTEILGKRLRDGGVEPPNQALREVVDNFIHAVPCTGSVVLDASFSNIYISDTGPGMASVDLALKPGYSTATSLQRSYIRGVGLGLHLAREELRSTGGDLYLDSTQGEGTYLRLALKGASPGSSEDDSLCSFCLTERQNNILFLLSEGEPLGPSQVAEELGIGVSTAHRELVKMQGSGLIGLPNNGKRGLSEVGRSYLQSLLSL
jgi:hypothetical protein